MTVLHVLERALEAPDVVQALGDLEVDAHAAHQHQLVDPVRVLGGDPQRDAAAEAVADQVRLLDAQGVHHAEGLVGPGVQAVVRRPPGGRSSRSRPCPARRSGSSRRAPAARAPVGVGRDARARAVDQDDGLVPGAGLQVVGADAVGVDVVADRGVGRVPGPAFPCPCPACWSCRLSSRRRRCVVGFVVRSGVPAPAGGCVRWSSGRRGRPRSTAWACPRPRRSAARRPRPSP